MKNLLKISAILITLMLIVSSCGKGTSKEERSEKIKTESSIYDVDYKDIVTVCEALDATIALFEELFALLEATDSDMGASQENSSGDWVAVAGNAMIRALLDEVACSEGPACDPGDINADGNVDVLDVVQVVNFIVGNSTPDEDQACAADYTGDGNIDVLDVVQMVGLITGG